MGWLTFLNPAFLWGALAASIPVIIHLINRRRARVVQFPTIKFVLLSERRVARKYRVKQWLLLALRTLILFLLTTALAEPVLQPDVGELAEMGQARAVALILDNTMSMAYQTAGMTAWELAQEVAELVVARKYRVKQWLLLALRTLILFLLTTALAEPVLQPDVGELAEMGQARAVALILDNTMSMAYQTAGMTSWQLAQEVAELVLQEFRPQDHGVLLPLVSTDAPPQALSSDRTGLMQQVRELPQTFQPGDFVRPFQHAYALLKTSEAPKKEIVVITDHTRTPWVGVEPATIKVMDPQVRLTVIAVGPKEAVSNATVREVRLDQPSLVAGVRTKLTASIATFGASDRKQVPVRLLVDSKTVDQRLLDLSKQGTTDVAFDVSFDQPGYRQGTVVLASDDLPVDDLFSFSVPVRKALRVLLIDGDPRTTLIASETFYLMNALNPDRAYRPGPIQPRVVPVEEAERLGLGEFDVVILANVRNLPPNLRTRLMDFANQGGGLWWFLGHQVDSADYNRTLFDTPTRLLPARLGPHLDRPDGHPVMLQSLDADHPVLKPMSERGQEALAGVRVRRLFSTEVASFPPTTRVLLALPDGRPLLLEGTAGQGRVLLFTSTGDVDWNELAVTTGYLPLIQTGVAYLARREGPERLASDTRLPQPIILKLSDQQREALITIADPQGKETRLFPQEQEGRIEVEYADLRLPGFYRLRVGSEDSLVAVNTPLEESDITSIHPDEVREKFPGSPFAFVEWERGQPLRPSQVELTSLAGWFLIGLLALMLVEGVFANRLR